MIDELYGESRGSLDIVFEPGVLESVVNENPFARAAAYSNFVHVVSPVF